MDHQAIIITIYPSIHHHHLISLQYLWITIKAAHMTLICPSPKWKKWRKLIAAKWVTGLQSGCLQRWGWWKEWWDQVAVVLLTKQSIVLPQLQEVLQDFKINKGTRTSGTAKEALGITAPIATPLGFVRIVTQAVPHFGGVALWVLRLINLFPSPL